MLDNKILESAIQGWVTFCSTKKTELTANCMVVFNAGAQQTNWFGPIARVRVLDAGLLNCEDVTPGVLEIPLVLLAPCLREKNTYFVIND